MTTTERYGAVGRWVGGGLALAAASYASYVAWTWGRYGRVERAADDEADALLDRFMPVCDVVERHHIAVAAPAGITLEAAREQDLLQSGLVRAVFKGRQIVLGSAPDDKQHPRPLLAQVLSLGWGVLAEVPGREVVVGAVTKPWEADVVFRALPPDEFAAFDEPGYVKIAWTLRADPIGSDGCVFRTETRALATDAFARAKFRRYWAFFSPGIELIRRMSLGPLRQEAERRARDRSAAAPLASIELVR